MQRIQLIFALLLGTVLTAQSTVTGLVTDGTEPLIGVSVQATGTTSGTITDFDGSYSVSVPAGADSLTFSYLGYQPQTVGIAGRTNLDVNLAEASELLQEVVVIGYGVQQKSDLTGAVGVVESEQLTDIPTQSLGQSLPGQGRGPADHSRFGSAGGGRHFPYPGRGYAQ